MSVCSDSEASDYIAILRKFERNIHVIVNEHSRKVNPNFPVGKRIITRNSKLFLKRKKPNKMQQLTMMMGGVSPEIC